MSRSKSNYSPRRAGEVVGVEVTADAERPVRISLFDHAHTYEFAWHDTADGPVIVDLRVTSREGVPITSDSLRRINTERLARTAKMRDTAQGAELARMLHENLKAALAQRRGDPATLVADAADALVALGGAAADAARQLVDSDPAEIVADALARGEHVRHAPADFVVKRKVGRPSDATPDFLADVARWAIQERPEGGNLYERVAARAGSELGRDVSVDMVKWWISRCKDLGLLTADQLRRRKAQ